MTFEVSIHPDVIAEIDEQVGEYETLFDGGGTDFLLAIEDTLGRIERLPNASPPRSEKNPQIRGYQIKNTHPGLAHARRFPFVLIYHVDDVLRKWYINFGLQKARYPLGEFLNTVYNKFFYLVNISPAILTRRSDGCPLFEEGAVPVRPGSGGDVLGAKCKASNNFLYTILKKNSDSVSC